MREVVSATGQILTVAGDGQFGFGGDGGPSTAAQLDIPQELAVDSAGEIFIADSLNNRVREATLTPVVAVSPDSTDTTVSTSGPTVVGQPATLIATVANISGTGTPTGIVTFLDNGTPLGAALLNASGQATLSVTGLTVASHSITAVYGGGIDFTGSGSAPVIQQVTSNPVGTNPTLPAPSLDSTRTVLLPSVLNAPKGRVVSVSITALVEPVAAGASPTGTVTFMIKNRKIATEALSSARAVMAFNTKRVVNKAITVIYSGDANSETSTSAPLTLTPGSLRTMARSLEASSSHKAVRSADSTRPA